MIIDLMQWAVLVLPSCGLGLMAIVFLKHLDMHRAEIEDMKASMLELAERARDSVDDPTLAEIADGILEAWPPQPPQPITKSK